jgi:hypothetical protein
VTEPVQAARSISSSVSLIFLAQMAMTRLSEIADI